MPVIMVIKRIEISSFFSLHEISSGIAQISVQSSASAHAKNCLLLLKEAVVLIYPTPLVTEVLGEGAAQLSCRIRVDPLLHVIKVSHGAIVR